jgi:glycolate oxidase FAD binding subunit
MAGSWGTLGVLSQVSFKVLPGVAARTTVMIDGLTDAQAVRAMSAALGSPYEVTGAAHLPNAPDGATVTMLRLEGFADSVAYRTGKLRDLMAPFGDVRTEEDPDKVQAAWAAIRDVVAFHGQPGDVWRISVKPSAAPELASRIGGRVQYDWGGGLIWALVPEGTDIRADLGAFDGHATLIRASEATRQALPVFQPEPAPLAALSRGLRAKFDPRGILNPGLMADAIVEPA